MSSAERGEPRGFEVPHRHEPSIEFGLKWERPLEVPIRNDFRAPVAITVGLDEQRSWTIWLVQAEWGHEDLRQEHRARFVLVQPDILRDDPTRGRFVLPSGGRVEIGPGTLELFPEADVGGQYCDIEHFTDDSRIVVGDYSVSGTWVRLDPRDVDVDFLWFNRKALNDDPRFKYS